MLHKRLWRSWQRSRQRHKPVPRPLANLSRAIARAGRDRVANRLTGVRLGRVERGLFLDAASSESISGLILDPPGASRSVQQGYLEAAKRLAEVGLLERRVLRAPTWARDGRRELPFFKDGRFWLHQEKRRRHTSRRVAVWRTPFGDEVLLAFRVEFSTGRTIRWSDARVSGAERASAGRPLAQEHRVWLEQEERERRIGRDRQLVEGLGPLEYLPDFVGGEEERRRWRLSAQVARSEHPAIGSRRLLEEATALYRSDTPTEMLLTAVRRRAEPARYSAEDLAWVRLPGRDAGG